MKVVYKKASMIDKLTECINLAKENKREIDYVSITRSEASRLLDDLRHSDVRYFMKQIVDFNACYFHGVRLKVEDE